jgi:GABA(A) receptor-associated protein
MFFQKNNIVNNSFVKKYSLDERKNEINRIATKYPNRIPIYINKAYNSDISEIIKHKFLVPDTLTMGEFMIIIRKNIQLKPEQSITLFIHTIDNNIILAPTSETLGSIYHKNILSFKNDDKYKNEIDGYLYLIYSGENTFG